MKTILILSVENDISTSNVIRWLDYLNPNIHVIRFHPTDLIEGNIYLDLKKNHISININNRSLSNKEAPVGVVWSRKWNSNVVKLNISDFTLRQNLSLFEKNLNQELNDLFNYFIHLLEQNPNIKWLNKPSLVTPNKLIQLRIAQECGLVTPDSYISTHIMDKDKKWITKPISYCIGFPYEEGFYSNYTSRIENDIHDNSFFPSYFQEEIKKLLEIRVFYIDGKCFSLSIQSQNNPKTEVDYRNYDFQKMNRIENYELPEKICGQINFFMKKMDIQTGSLDFIYTPDEKYIFLEVNPCGQYSIFNNCNIYPDKFIAEYLIKCIL